MTTPTTVVLALWRQRWSNQRLTVHVSATERVLDASDPSHVLVHSDSLSRVPGAGVATSRQNSSTRPLKMGDLQRGVRQRVGSVFQFYSKVLV